MKLILSLLLLIGMAFGQDFQVKHASNQIITNKCQQELDFKLNGIVQIGDPIEYYVRYLKACTSCYVIGDRLDSLGNAFIPDYNYGPLGIKCGNSYCTEKFISRTGSVGTGVDHISVEFFCPASDWYGIYGVAWNGNF